MSSYSILVTTCDKYMWIMRLFAELFNTHWGEGEIVNVLCESSPKFDMPSNFKFIPVGEWSKDRWCEVVRNYIRGLESKNIVLLLDDYLLTRDVDIRGVRILSDYMIINKDILRIDLTADRLHARGDSRAVDDYGNVLHYDLIEAKNTSYQMSLQAGIFNVDLLSLILRDGLDPWRVELESQDTIDYFGMIVLGTRQVPIRYINALGTGTPVGKINLRGINPTIIERAKHYGWIDKDYEVLT